MKPQLLLFVGLLVAAVCTVGIGASARIWLTIVLLVISGLFYPCIQGGIQTLIVRNTEGAFMGRVSGAITPVFMGMMVVGMFLSGYLKDAWSLPGIYAVSGGLIMIGALLLLPLWLGKETKRKRVKHPNGQEEKEMNPLEEYVLSPERQLTDAERKLVWKKPLSHKISEEERRVSDEIKRNWNRGEMKIANILLEGDAGSGKTQLAKALSANFGSPYTKVTCFADMDKSDIIGAILPVVSSEPLEKLEPADQAGGEAVEYRFYPSEIVRAYQNGYLLEIQEPNVIRDAAVLMALNSALEPDGSINLPTEIIRRHPDFIAVITTNRSYAGSRPLNEALRDRIQHTEKMDLPTKEVMIERAIAKTGYTDELVLSILADVIIILDQTARAHAMKGVAGMRSFFYWADAVACGASARESLYHKVIYKITTVPEEIKLLEEALEKRGLFAGIEEVATQVKKNETVTMRLRSKPGGYRRR
ncbi:MFS transporter [Paenibacillus sp. P26]|nr:MFS transporter [Paenibacillus sp. P26]